MMTCGAVRHHPKVPSRRGTAQMTLSFARLML
jgi:hypothetical protein